MALQCVGHALGPDFQLVERFVVNSESGFYFEIQAAMEVSALVESGQLAAWLLPNLFMLSMGLQGSTSQINSD